MRRPLLLIFPAYCLGLWLAGFLPLPLWLFFIWGVLGAGVAVWAVYRQWQYASCWLLGAVVLSGLVRMSAVSALPDIFIAHYVGKEPVRAAGIIIDTAGTWAEGKGHLRAAYLVDVQHIENASGTYRATGKMRLTVRQTDQQPLCQIGDRVVVRGKLHLPRPGSNPGDLDYRAYFLRRGIGAVMSCDGQELDITGTSVRYEPLRKMRHLRETLGNAMTRHMGTTEAALLKGLVFGERTALPAEIGWDFADTGLVHILSVSGYHVALLAGVIYGLLRLANCSEAVRIKITMLCIAGYVLLVGFSPPVVRSALMAVVLLGADLLLRKKDGLQALLVAGSLLLLWEPRQLYDIGFQLSFGATAGLILLSPGFSAAFRKYLPAGAASISAATVAATLAVLPFLANYFQQISLIALLSNIVLTYPVSLLIVSGMLAALLGGLWAPPAYLLNLFNNWLAGLLIRLTALFAGVPGAALHIPVFSWWAAAGYYLLLIWICQLYTPGWLPAFSHIWRDRRRRLLFCGLGVLLGFAWYGSAASERGLTVTFLNVGQGDAAFLRTPHNQGILIDGGPGLRTDGTGYDTGEKIIVPFLRRAGIRTLDLVVLSHAHEDHAGGLRTVLGYLPVKGLLAAPGGPESGKSPALEALCRSKGIPVMKPAAGQRLEIDGVVLEVISTGDLPTKDDQGNEASLVIRVSYGAHQFLFTGDLEGEAEQKLRQTSPKLTCTVLKVGHHGSAKGTSEAFLAMVNPAFAVISVGETNPYGHPAPAVLRRLQAYHVQSFRTDRDGAVSFFSDGHRLKVTTYMQK